MSNKKKNDTLGMPHGTAANKLRKTVLFHLLKKLGEDTCFRCNEQIVNLEDLSMEHKKPWEGISADLFWDINNIAFAHLRCNIRNHRTPHKVRFGGDTSWCSRCKKFKQKNDFYTNASSVSGVQSECKDCRSELKSSGRWSNGNS